MREPWPLLSLSLDRGWTVLSDTSVGMPHGGQVRGIYDCLSCLEGVSVVLDKFALMASSSEGGLPSEAA